MGNNISTVGINTSTINNVAGALKYQKAGKVYGISIPKLELNASIKERALQYPGIYFLIGRDKNRKVNNVYVGKAGFRNSRNNEENQAILARLREHADSTSEWYQDLWEYAVAFTSSEPSENDKGQINMVSSWELTEISNLENILYHSIPKHIKINSAEPPIGSKDNIENVDYNSIINEIKAVLIKARLRAYPKIKGNVVQ